MSQRILSNTIYRNKPVYDIQSIDGYRVAFRRGTADERVIAHSFSEDIFFNGVPEYRPGEDHVIIEIGAHIGTFSLLASNICSKGRIYAIEASEGSYDLLQMNAALNSCTNISAHHLAISNQNGSSTLYWAKNNWGNSLVKKLSPQCEVVDCCTLSTFFDRHGIDRVDFMKLNCEGSEFPIILNAQREVLRRCNIICILYHCDLWAENTEDDLISHLSDSGFSCVTKFKSRKRGWIVATRIP